MRLFEPMVNRIFIILMVGIVLSTALAAWLGHSERQRLFRAMRASRTADHVEQFVLLLEATQPAARSVLLENAPKLGLQVVDPAPGSPESPKGEDPLIEVLQERLGSEHKVARTAEGDVRLTLSDGTPLAVRVKHSPRRSEPTQSLVFWLYQLLYLVCIGVLAYFVARMTTDPLRDLAQAARDLGRDIDREPLQESGPREIRHAARAFNLMQARLRRHIRQRNQMLAAISHDLQTPLTRLRLRLEKVQDEALREKLLSDLSAMQVLVAEGLDLARSVETQEPVMPLDLQSLLDSVTQDAVDAGHSVDLRCDLQLSLSARPNDLRRCLTNLIDNAVKYGKVAHVSADREGGEVVIRVADEGPGIPEDKLTRVFEPFVRLEESRSRDTGGSGIGLTIALNIAQRHGGDLSLHNRPGGGVEAVLRLPCSP